MEIKEYKLEIIKIIDEAIEVKTFRVKREKDMEFYAGQFFMVSLEDDPKLQRAYSIASSPDNKEYVDITVTLVGKFTHKLFECKLGDYLMFKGPYGKFYFEDDMKNNLVLIGGGCGIAALMGITRYCKSKNLPNNIKLLYSSKTPEHIVYRKELEKLNEERDNFDYIQTITRPKPEHNWNGRTGRIDEDMIKENIEEGSLYFLCGPVEFVKGVISTLEKLGIKKEQIRTDIWG
ncbi:oxidoreductase [Candidatus Woesearchaeota archaeon]|nr:oxidoreductase [Candidatus Woesearchaeota archaeon]|tara:strand:- start:238 stop:936 length:699 start_codon:yes stop_codon:yes gene_type:complete